LAVPVMFLIIDVVTETQETLTRIWFFRLCGWTRLECKRLAIDNLHHTHVKFNLIKFVSINFFILSGFKGVSCFV